MIPIKLTFDLLIPTTPPMSHHSYNFALVKHSDNDLLAPVVPRFETLPSSPSIYVHGPHQVWELGEDRFFFD
jgi:hypothetical protein